MKLSVVIPFYSNRDLLIESIDSVINQTLKADEIIVVSDGSQESIDDLVNYNDTIKILTQDNQGCGIARLNGILSATGDYIAFMDSDDIWPPQKLKEQILFMQEKQLNWCHTAFCYKDFELNNTRTVDNRNDYGHAYYLSFVSLRIASPTVIINKKVLPSLRKLKIPKECKYGQDGYIFQTLAKDYPLGLYNKCLLFVRYRSNHTSASSIKRFKIRDTAYYEYKNNKWDISPTIKVIYYIYHMLNVFFDSKIVNSLSTSKKEFIGKCMWLIPHFIEQTYRKYLLLRRDEEDVNYLGCVL